MVTGSTFLAAAIHLLSATSGAAPSVAVLTLEHKQGVSADVAELLTENLSATVRETRRFSRVIGTKDIEQVLGFERQKQLLNCESSSCMAELAGALGVDYIISGTLGQLGSTWLFNAMLFNTRTGDTEGKVSRKIKGQTEEVLLEAVDAIVADLLRDSKVSKPGAAALPAPAPAPAPVAAPAVAVATETPPASTPAETPAATPTATTTSSSGGMAAKALMAAGGATLAATLIPVLMGLAGLGMSVAILAAFDLGALEGTGLGAPASLAYVGGYVVLGLGVVLGLVSLVAGGAVLGTGVVLN